MQVTPKLWYGHRPDNEETFKQLYELGITCIFSVTNSEYEYQSDEFYYFKYPLLDFHPNPMYNGPYPISTDKEIHDAVEKLYELIFDGHKVFLHCDAGICRAPTVAAAYLVRSGIKETFDEAFEFVGGCRSYPLYDNVKRLYFSNSTTMRIKELEEENKKLRNELKI